MTVDDSFFIQSILRLLIFALVIFVFTCCKHDAFACEVPFQEIKELIFVLYVLVALEMSRHSHHMVDNVSWEATLGSSVSPMKFCPCFSDQTDPDISVCTLSKCKTSIRFDRQVFINDYWSFLAVDKEIDQVDSRFIDLFCHKFGFNAFRLLGKCTNHRQEIAVT